MSADPDLLNLLSIYEPEIAYKAWAETQHYRTTGQLPPDAEVIERVEEVDGSLIWIHSGKYSAKPSQDH